MTSSPFFLCLLGGVSLEGPSGPVSGRVVQRRRMAFLALLATEIGRGLSRDKLAGYLWPENDETEARRFVSDTLYVLRKTLGEDAVLAYGDVLRLNPEIVSTDVASFEAALENEELERAVEFYHGSFLDGFHPGGGSEFEHWRDAERHRLAELHASALESLAEAAEEQSDLPRAVLWWKRLAAQDPYNSRIAQRVAWALATSGDRGGAIEFLRTHELLLREELGVEPSPDVLAYTERLKREGALRPAEFPAPESTDAPAIDSPGGQPVSGSAVDGTSPAATAEASLRPAHSPQSLSTRRKAVALALAAATLSGTLMAAWFLSRGPSREVTSPVHGSGKMERLVVFPFSYRGSDQYAHFGEGLVYLLSLSLDGAGDLRTVDPYSVFVAVRREGGNPLDPNRGRQMAGSFDANRFVMGDIAEVADRLRITAWLYEGDAPAAQTAVEGEAGEFYRLIDDLTAKLAVEYIGEDGARLVEVGARTTSSLDALKAYLKGESAYRRGRDSLALQAFQRALEADSTFALAWYRVAASAINTWAFDLAHLAMDHAMRQRDRLPARERQLVEALSAHLRGSTDESEHLYRDLLQRYPDDVEAWFRLGALLYTNNRLRARSLDEVREPFSRVLRHEPDHRRALELWMYAEAFMGQWAVADSLAQRVVPAELPCGGPTAVAGPGQPPVRCTAAGSLLWRAALAYASGDEVAQQRILSEAAQATEMTRYLTAAFIGSFAPDPRDPLDLARLAAQESTRSPELRALALLELANFELAAGRPRRALAVLDTLAALHPAWAIEYRALFVSSPFLEAGRDELTALRTSLESWPAEAAPWSSHPYFYVHAHNGIHPHLRLYMLGILSAQLGEHAAALRYADDLERLETPREAGSLGDDLGRGIRAQVAWERGRPEDAIAALETAPRHVRYERAWASPFYSGSRERFLRAMALDAVGREQEALRWYATVSKHSMYDKIYLAPSYLRRAEIYKRLDNRDKATLHYSRFIEFWEDAGEELQPQVEVARRTLARLTVEK